MFSSYKVSFYKKKSQNVLVQVNFYIILMEIEDIFSGLFFFAFGIFHFCLLRLASIDIPV